MITPVLERMLLNGTANFQIVAHAFSMLGRIPCPQGKLAIITKIIWYPFLDWPFNTLVNNTWASLLGANEYQLRIESAKNKNMYIFRNSIKWQMSSTVAINMNAAVAAADLQKLAIQPGEPVTIDTFIVCEKFIKLVINKNPMVNITSTNAAPNAVAGEPNTPNGIGNIASVGEKYLMATITNTQQQTYNPPSNEWSGLPSGGARNKQGYSQDYVPASGNYMHSELTAPGAVAGSNLLYSTTPLVNFHVVYVNANIADDLQTTR